MRRDQHRRSAGGSILFAIADCQFLRTDLWRTSATDGLNSIAISRPIWSQSSTLGESGTPFAVATLARFNRNFPVTQCYKSQAAPSLNRGRMSVSGEAPSISHLSKKLLVDHANGGGIRRIPRRRFAGPSAQNRLARRVALHHLEFRPFRAETVLHATYCVMAFFKGAPCGGSHGE